MKTEKRRGWKRVSSSAFFAVFPGCFASGWRQFYCRRPVCGGCQWRIQFAILQFAFAKGSLRVSWRGDDNPSGPAGQLPFTQGSLFFSHQRVFLVPAGYCFSDKPSNFRFWVQGQCPWWVQGRCPAGSRDELPGRGNATRPYTASPCRSRHTHHDWLHLPCRRYMSRGAWCVPLKAP